MNLIELITAFLIIGAVAGFAGARLGLPEWLTLVVILLACVAFYLLLLASGRRHQRKTKDR
jgi:uncharacterized membrane protein YfcA